MICVFLLFQLCFNLGNNFLIIEIFQIHCINFDALSYSIEIIPFMMLSAFLIILKSRKNRQYFCIYWIMVIDDIPKMS